MLISTIVSAGILAGLSVAGNLMNPPKSSAPSSTFSQPPVALSFGTLSTPPPAVETPLRTNFNDSLKSSAAIPIRRSWKHTRGGLRFGEQLSIFESRNVEFKQAHSSDKFLYGHFARYACAFLNSEGGTLLLGVSDDGCVCGISCDRARYDRLCLGFDRIANTLLYPQLDPSLYRVDVIPVKDAPSTFADCVVLQITFECPLNDKIVYFYNQKPLVRCNASVTTMTPLLVADRLNFGRRLAHHLQASGDSVVSAKKPSSSTQPTGQADAPARSKPSGRSRHRNKNARSAAPQAANPPQGSVGTAKQASSARHARHARHVSSSRSAKNEQPRHNSHQALLVTQDKPLIFPRSMSEYQASNRN